MYSDFTIGSLMLIQSSISQEGTFWEMCHCAKVLECTSTLNGQGCCMLDVMTQPATVGLQSYTVCAYNTVLSVCVSEIDKVQQKEYQPQLVFDSILLREGWRGDSLVRSTCCSCVPTSDSSQLPVTPTTGDLTASSVFHILAQSHIHTCTYIKIKYFSVIIIICVEHTVGYVLWRPEWL